MVLIIHNNKKYSVGHNNISNNKQENKPTREGRVIDKGIVIGYNKGIDNTNNNLNQLKKALNWVKEVL